MPTWHPTDMPQLSKSLSKSLLHLPDSFEEGVLIRRYKRFLADVKLSGGDDVVVHCPNPGSMLGCAEPGSSVLLRRSDDPKRKLPYTWVMTVNGSTMISVDTLLANKVVHAALKSAVVPELAKYDRVIPEFTYGDSRFDFCLEGDKLPSCLLEVKSTTLADGKIAMFPDAKTARGRKHLRGLMDARAKGLRAVQFFCISRNDVDSFAPAEHIDAEYARQLREAAAAGVEIVAWTMSIERNGERLGVGLERPVEVVLS